jgi:hypothetical protein
LQNSRRTCDAEVSTRLVHESKCGYEGLVEVFCKGLAP